MRIGEFEWNTENIEHIARHSVTPAEVEEACYFRPLIRRARFSRYLILGQTESGRYLAIVIEYRSKGRAYTITARDMNDAERKKYLKER